jgi:hypothetical protein
MKGKLLRITSIAGVLLFYTVFLLISCTPPIHTGGGKEKDGPYDLTTLEGFERALAD